ncbi:MAG: cell wall hydrolase/autolysin [Chloroflexi bacterium]|nr:cell wall hydrolase/autolysin [Chloroflexota bacterium]
MWLPLLLIGAVASLVLSCASSSTPTLTGDAQAATLSVRDEKYAGTSDWADSRADLISAGGSAVLAQQITSGPSGEFPSFPLPVSPQPPLGPGVFASGFRDPLPETPVWNPAGPKRVGLQVGHWLTNQVPDELRRLSPGSSAGGWAEWQVAHMIATRTAEILEAAGFEVDLLPTTIPARYRAHAFVAIHLDGDISGAMHGYKLARSGFSSIPEADDEFIRTMYQEYGDATGLPRDSDAHISRRMIYYYAFNTRRYAHAVDLGTPTAIIETGFLTNASDRAFLTGRPEVAARGIANGIMRFLDRELGSAQRAG